jgi:hypothetical protein
MSELPWIKVWTAIPRHPKVQRLERELGVKDALGIVLRLWCWTADYCPGGDLTDTDATEAAKQIRGGSCRRGASEVVRGLVTSGFLDKISDGFRVHDWYEMQTKHAEADEKKRAQAAARQAEYRRRKALADAARNAEVTQDVTHNVTRNVTQVVTLQSREDKTREEKRAFPPVNGSEQGPTGESGDLLSLRAALTRSLGLPELITIAKPSETASVVAFFEEQLRHVTPESLLADCLLFAAKSTNGTPSSLKWFQGWISKLPTGATP